MTLVDHYRPPAYLTERQAVPSLDWMVDWYLADARSRDDSWEQDPDARTWRASQLGYCLRQQTLQRLGVPTPRVFDAKTIRTFAWGNMVHDFVKDVFSELGVTVAEEPALSDVQNNISGHADLIWNPVPSEVGADDPTRIGWLNQLTGLYGDGNIPDVYLGLELKSQHSLAMKRIFDQGPGPEHRAQAAIYKHMCLHTAGAITDPTTGRTWHPANVERWFLGYVGKDAVGLLSYEVEDAWVDDALERLDALNEAWGRLLPKCDCTARYNGKGPMYCDYSEDGGASCCGRDTRGQVAKSLRALRG